MKLINRLFVVKKIALIILIKIIAKARTQLSAKKNRKSFF